MTLNKEKKKYEFKKKAYQIIQKRSEKLKKNLNEDLSFRKYKKSGQYYGL